MALALVAALGSGGGAGRPAVNGLPVVAGAFAIGYVHSIYRAPSAEVFTVEGRRFTMRAVLSVNEGVLDYYAVEGERVRLPGDVWLLRLAEPASYEELSLLTTSVGRRTVVSGGRCLPLYPATGAREVRLTVGLTQDAHGGPCDHNQSFFLKTMYNPTDIATISTEDTQKPQTSPVPG